MDIPELSMNLSKINLSNALGPALLGKQLDMAEASGEAMADMMSKAMELSVNPHIGGAMDLSI
ncbi:MAG: YjfB family protein [Lachnospiraceae bacterium]|nr:YjfB family protein [Lachnospiraceae bacterium]